MTRLPFALLLVTLVGLAFCSGAGDFNYAASSQIQSIFIDDKTDNEQIEDPLCRGGKWEQSNWDLVDTSTKTINTSMVITDAVYRSSRVLPGHIGNVEVCSSSGLLRIKPNGGKR